MKDEKEISVKMAHAEKELASAELKLKEHKAVKIQLQVDVPQSEVKNSMFPNVMGSSSIIDE